ncbi:MAG: 30S ribosomal protein S16 [Spirochaetota bacterium]|nr:30S ribosomal protein S16 [Spirochaetota bacterium]
MSTNIRLMRLGKKKAPYYRVVVAHSRNARDGAYIESLGTYRPVESSDQILINVTRFDEWIKMGAIPSQTVTQLVLKARAIV